MALGSAPLAAPPPPSAQDDYRAAEDEKQTNDNPLPSPKSPNLPASLIQKKHHAGQDRTGEQSHWVGGRLAKEREEEEAQFSCSRRGEQAGRQGYVMAMQGVDRDRCQWTALPKCNLPQPPTYFWMATSGDV